MIFIILDLQFLNCIENGKNISCTKDLEEKIDDVLLSNFWNESFPRDAELVGGWNTRLHFLMGWNYIWESNVSMSRANEFKGSYMFLALNTSKDERSVVYIHDKNDLAFSKNYIDTVKLTGASDVYIKIKEVVKRKNCQPSETYSFRKCIDHFTMKVKHYCKFFIKFEISFLHRNLDVELSGTQKKIMKDTNSVIFPWHSSS